MALIGPNVDGVDDQVFTLAPQRPPLAETNSGPQPEAAVETRGLARAALRLVYSELQGEKVSAVAHVEKRGRFDESVRVNVLMDLEEVVGILARYHNLTLVDVVRKFPFLAKDFDQVVNVIFVMGVDKGGYPCLKMQGLDSENVAVWSESIDASNGRQL